MNVTSKELMFENMRLQFQILGYELEKALTEEDYEGIEKMSKRVAIVESCEECPFLELKNLPESKCIKWKITGKKKDLWYVCKLPNHLG